MTGIAAHLEQLISAGRTAGATDEEVRAEAAVVVGGVLAASAPTPAVWTATFGADAIPFAAAAATGEALRRQPTAVLRRLLEQQPVAAASYATALADLAIAACSLTDPSLETINAAGFTARAQLGAAGVGASSPAPVSAVAPATAKVDAPKAPVTSTTVESVEELLARLDRLVGLDEVKTKVRIKVAVLRERRLRQAHGLKVADMTHHMVFVGSPGTGKTTVARILAAIYRALGVVQKGQLVETDRSGLVAGYEGQTALKTADIVTKALGGMLFIDEAYALAGDQFGMEAIATLLKAMEDHRHELVVVVAGYQANMDEFINSNPGIASRIPTSLMFEDYTNDQLVEIFRHMCADEDYEPVGPCLDRVRALFTAFPRGPAFGNARLARNVFERALELHAYRLQNVAEPSLEQLRTLLSEDVPTLASLIPTRSLGT